MTQQDPKPNPPPSQSPFNRLLEDLPSQVRERLNLQQPATSTMAPEALEYHRLRSQLPQSVQDFMDGQVLPSEEEKCPCKPHWCVCESPEGEFLKIRIFRELSKLVGYLAALEGREIAVWNFWGVPVRMTLRNTTSNQRYLILPGGEEAVLIARGPLTKIPASLVLPEDEATERFQLDGWLGHPALAEASSSEYLQGNREIRAKRSKKQAKHNDDGDEAKGNPVE